MIFHLLRRFVPFILVILILASVFSVVAAANTVPSSRLGDQKSAINASTLKPTQCAALNLTTIVVCPVTGGACNGTTGNDLIIGSVFADAIKGNKGADCILGGGGDDNITGGSGGDVCIGGPGTDTFKSCATAIQ